MNNDTSIAIIILYFISAIFDCNQYIRCVHTTVQVLAFRKVIYANMPEITKTCGNDEGVQYNFKELLIEVAKKEVC